MDFASELNALIKLSGINNTKLAAAIGVSNSLITSWRRGEKVPSAENLDKLATYFGVTVDSLLGREEPLEDNGNEFEVLAASSDVPINQWPESKKRELLRYARYLNSLED